MWKNLRVWKKLAICIVPLVLVIIGSAVDSNQTLNSLQHTIELTEAYDDMQASFLHREIEHLQWAQQLVLYVTLQKNTALGIQTDPTQCALGTWLAGPERARTERLVPALVPVLRAVDVPHVRLHQSAVTIRELAAKGEWTAAKTTLEGETLPALKDILSRLNEGTEHIAATLVQVREKAAAESSRSFLINWAAMGVGVLVGLACIFALMRTILGPLGKLRVYAQSCETGKCQSLNIDRADEFGELANSLRSMTANLNRELAFSRSMLKGLPVPAALYNLDNRLTFANQHMLDLLELDGKPEDYYGQTSGEFLFRQPDRETASVICLRTGEPTERAVEVTTYKGNGKVALTEAAPLYNDTGAIISVLSVWMDTTDIHRRQQEVAQARDAMLRVAGKAQDVAEKLAVASQELSVQIAQVNTGSEQQHTQAQETAAAMTEMNASINAVNDNAHSADKVSREALEHAQEGQTLVVNMLDAMTGLEKQSRAIHADMGELRKHADGVGAVLDVISDIADQTNLLALNAAIEAARAGESGRGFAVVADSVRQLAEKTMQATKSVVEVIGNIQNGASNSAAGVERAVDTIKATAELAGKSGQALEEIVTLTKAVSAQVGAIAGSATEQTRTSELITRAVAETSAVAGEAAEAMGNAARATEEMARQIGVLHGLVEELQ